MTRLGKRQCLELVEIMIFFLKQPATALIRQSCGEQRIKRASYATYTSTFPPNDSSWQRDLSSIRRDTYFCWGSLAEWLGLWGGWSEPAVSQDQLSFLKTTSTCHAWKLSHCQDMRKQKNLGSRLFDFRCVYSCSNSTKDAKQVVSSRKDYRTHQSEERWLQTDVLLVYLWFCRHTFCSHSLYILLFCLCVCL